MENAVGPKRLQRSKKYKEAIDYYIKRYNECLHEHDVFLSGLYLDEIAQTLIESREGRISFDELGHKLAEVTEVESRDQILSEQVKSDINVSLRKRFPEKFRDSDIVDSDDYLAQERSYPTT